MKVCVKMSEGKEVGKLAVEDFIFKSEICSKVHKFPEGLEVLNEVCTMVCVLDYRSFENPKKVWANAPWLEFSGETLQEFQGYDFAGNMSQGVKEKSYLLGREIHVERKTLHFEYGLRIRIHWRGFWI